ncbi:S24 family peptidase [Bacillus licheniformis]|nr:S24 family peptidase [Bacillus licheniformis]
MRINGDSMNRIMPHDSLIAVRPVPLSNLRDGDIVVYSDGGDYAVKRFTAGKIKLYLGLILPI